jgi:hypothetical protein
LGKPAGRGAEYDSDLCYRSADFGYSSLSPCGADSDSVSAMASEEPVRVNISLLGAALEAQDRTAKELSLSRSGAIAYLALEREVSVRVPSSRQAKKRAKA